MKALFEAGRSGARFATHVGIDPADVQTRLVHTLTDSFPPIGGNRLLPVTTAQSLTADRREVFRLFRLVS
jgi:hypothetical protein